jgi:type IV pilus assembly protein PilA
MTMSRSDEKGFTLIELMVVVLVIAILLAIAIPTFLGARGRGQDTVAKTSLRNAISSAAGSTGSGVVTFPDAAAMATEEPSLTFTASASTGPKVVSVGTSATAWGGAALSASGRCFAIRLDSANVTTYAVLPAGSCTGSTALTAATSTGQWTISASPYRDAVVGTAGVTRYWPLDETSGSVALDLSGNSATATLTSPTPTLGQPGLVESARRTAFGFSGVAKVSLPSMASTSSYTIAAWVRTPSAIDGFHDTIVAGTNFRFQVQPNGSQHQLKLETTGGGGIYSPTMLPISTVAMVAVTSDGTTERLFIDGVEVTARTALPALNWTSGRIGYDDVSSIGGPDTWGGVIDEVSVFNRALTAPELLALRAIGS